MALAAAIPAQAADDVSLADLKAATRSLGFLQNLPQGKDYVVGIVYPTPTAKALGQQTADRMRGLPGPNNTALRPEIISLQELAAHADGLNALYLLLGAENGGIADVARRKHLLVMSNNPACLDQHCCMLMVRDSGRVEIVLDSDLAQAAGISFSSVFAMMVKHK